MNLNDAFDKIRIWIGDRKAKSYTRNGCQVSMANLESNPRKRVVLDVDKAYPTGKSAARQCDLILFHIDHILNTIISVPMELKRGGVDASEVVTQLQHGASIADRCTPKDIEINLVPVLFYGGNLHPYQRNRLKTTRITFRGEKYPINIARCGYKGNLAKVLAKSTTR